MVIGSTRIAPCESVCYTCSMDKSTGTVTLEAFADRVGCHFTTASRLRSGQRLPGRKLLGKIVKEYHLDPQEALDAFTDSNETFGAYLRTNVFGIEDDGDSTPIHLNNAA